jgi:hypothetical protein
VRGQLVADGTLVNHFLDVRLPGGPVGA